MSTQAPRSPRDLWVIGAVVVGVAGGALATYFAFSKRRVENVGRIIAHLEQLVNRVEARRPGTLRWDVAATGMDLVDKHTVRTSALSGVRVLFATGSSFAVGEGTTVTVREPHGDNPVIALEVGVIRPEVPMGTAAGSASARVALPGGRVVTLTKKVGTSEAGEGKTGARAIAKVVVEPETPVVIQANEDLAVKFEDAPTGRSGFELKRGVAVSVEGDGAREDLVLPQRPEIDDVQIVGEGSLRELLVRLKNIEPGVRYQAEIARDSAFTEGRRLFWNEKAELRIPVSEPGKWFVRVVAYGRGQVESGPSFTKTADVPVGRTATPGSLSKGDVGTGAVADAGAGAVADAGADSDAGTSGSGLAVAAPDEPACARVKGGGSIAKRSGAERRGGCAFSGDAVVAMSVAIEIAAPGVGDARLQPGGRMQVEKIGDGVFSLKIEQGVAEIRAREHAVQVTGAVGIRLRPRAVVVTSVLPGAYVWVEGVTGRAAVDMGSGYKELRAGEAYQWGPKTKVRLVRPYREAGIVVSPSSRTEFIAPSERATLRAEWNDPREPVDVTVKHGGKIVLKAPTRKASFAYDTHGYGSYAIAATTRGGTTVYDATVMLKRDPWEKIDPVAKTFTVTGAMRSAVVDYDTLLPNLRFSWEPIPQAKKYYFSLATDQEFKKRLLDEESVTPDFAVPSSRFSEKTKVYYWRAVAGGGDADDVRGPFKLTFRFKSNAPSLWIQTPKSHTTIRRGTALLTSGDAIPKSKLRVNQAAVEIDASGKWSASLTLPPGENWVVYEATDPSGRTQRFLRRVDVE